MAGGAEHAQLPQGECRRSRRLGAEIREKSRAQGHPCHKRIRQPHSSTGRKKACERRGHSSDGDGRRQVARLGEGARTTVMQETAARAAQGDEGVGNPGPLQAWRWALVRWARTIGAGAPPVWARCGGLGGALAILATPSSARPPLGAPPSRAPRGGRLAPGPPFPSFDQCSWTSGLLVYIGSIVFYHSCFIQIKLFKKNPKILGSILKCQSYF